jgi:hypothetical protein
MIEIDENNEIHTTYSISSPQDNAERGFSLKRMTFTETVEYIEKNDFYGGDIICKLIDIDSNPLGGWYWGSTTSVVFRKSAIELLCHTKAFENWRCCAGNLVINFAHIIGGSCLMYTPLSLYRRHSANGFSSNYVIGNKQYFSPQTGHKITFGRENIICDLLETIQEGKEQFFEIMRQEGIDKIVHTLFRHSKREEIFKHKNLLEGVCGEKGFKKLNHKLKYRQIKFMKENPFFLVIPKQRKKFFNGII